VPDIIFQVVLPLFWLCLVLGVGANRWQLRRRLDRDPVVVRPWHKADSPARYLEQAMFLCTVLFTADVVLNAVAPGLVADTLSIQALRTSWAVGALGLVSLTLGLGLAAVAIRQMGVSWRIGIDNQAPGPLVSRGIFSRVRHPIYGGMLLTAAGFAAVTADLLSLTMAAAVLVGLPVQARLEETFMSSRYPQEYPGYVERTRRFWPRMS
jgi:protein-S-isoprenylcysteine O-methyltransferase Ste14